ncbi:hypothetical protein AVEN_151838-1 [Araneus ventricosus]|uniref:Uncharacterized protein n=1 Tax=Araneus ventricosus TaxID=182803 RepID=A0A4Y2NB31_ARAVE|nr:hypothetical protein AVEN_151838-1 [Araneus ventricosus]
MTKRPRSGKGTRSIVHEIAHNTKQIGVWSGSLERRCHLRCLVEAWRGYLRSLERKSGEECHTQIFGQSTRGVLPPGPFGAEVWRECHLKSLGRSLSGGVPPPAGLWAESYRGVPPQVFGAESGGSVTSGVWAGGHQRSALKSPWSGSLERECHLRSLGQVCRVPPLGTEIWRVPPQVLGGRVWRGVPPQVFEAGSLERKCHSGHFGREVCRGVPPQVFGAGSQVLGEQSLEGTTSGLWSEDLRREYPLRSGNCEPTWWTVWRGHLSGVWSGSLEEYHLRCRPSRQTEVQIKSLSVPSPRVMLQNSYVNITTN